jgi:putative oxidoreductase
MEPAHSIEPPSAVEFIPSQEHPSMPGPIPARWSGYLLSVLRIVAAFLFIAHGTQKLFAWPIDEPRDAAQLLSLMGLAGVLETFGGTLLLLGWLTRPVAFLLAGEMAVAYFMSHLPRGFWPILNRGELPVLYCFLFLYLAAIGGGPWSIDAARSRRPGGD